MNYVGMSMCDTANGPGVRVSLFVAGCRLHCKGCFNPESWGFDAGKKFDPALDAQKIIEGVSKPFVSGFSLLGGDPFEPEHEAVLLDLLRDIKRHCPKDKTIWAWTGRKLEQVVDSPLLQYIDVLVDGPFIEKFKITEQGQWKGSSNQRVIEIRRSS